VSVLNAVRVTPNVIESPTFGEGGDIVGFDNAQSIIGRSVGVDGFVLNWAQSPLYVSRAPFLVYV
jgi:hypothetical protein